MNSHGYDENGTSGPDIKRTTTVASRMSDCHGNRTAFGCFNHNMLIAFLLNISGGKCLEIISVENIKNENSKCMPVL